MRIVKNTLAILLCGALFSPVWAGAIKVWTSGDTVTIADLNANFQHIHNVMVGGHGARLVNSDVSANAQISDSKLQNGHGIAKAFAVATAACSCGAPCTCTITDSMNVTSVAKTATGAYTVTLNYTATDNKFATFCTAGASNTLCVVAPTSTTTASIAMTKRVDGTADDQPFSVMVLDGN